MAHDDREGRRTDAGSDDRHHWQIPDPDSPSRDFDTGRLISRLLLGVIGFGLIFLLALVAPQLFTSDVPGWLVVIGVLVPSAVVTWLLWDRDRARTTRQVRSLLDGLVRRRVPGPVWVVLVALGILVSAYALSIYLEYS